MMIRPGTKSVTTMMKLMMALLCVLAAAPSVRAQGPGRPIAIGREVAVRSEILGEDRPLLIHLPAGYGQAQITYPVLYLLDAEAHFVHVVGIVDYLAMQSPIPQNGLIPQMIVVGIPNTNRPRDLTPQIAQTDTYSRYVPARDSEKFLRFLDEELIPYVDDNFRTAPYRILAGHCLAGLFAIHSLLAEPEMFDAYLAITPYLILDEKLPLAYTEPFLEEHPDLDCFLYLVAGAEAEEWVASIDEFAGILKEHAPEGMRWDYRRMTDDGHGVEVHKALYDALETLYAGWSAPDDLLAGGLRAVEAHYGKLSRKFGYTVNPPELMLNQLGYLLLQQRRADDAIEVFTRNVELYPGSWNVYDSLGEAHLARGEKEAAIRNYLKSLEINPDNVNGIQMLKRIRRN
ncbi:MAG: hypothetical protein JSV91_12740 [Phycisphaerales bacterium]|nr:MAG: hypothetical protein JSV91_12740 [Phycisphaerales bacterium]